MDKVFFFAGSILVFIAVAAGFFASPKASRKPLFDNPIYPFPFFYGFSPQQKVWLSLWI
jgi:hypothetical protein